uniref:CASP-like protein n=1 Tax=Oryza punctata TaxID=4537 RepID=A0A0E0M5J9_ORYPU
MSGSDTFGSVHVTSTSTARLHRHTTPSPVQGHRKAGSDVPFLLRSGGDGLRPDRLCAEGGCLRAHAGRRHLHRHLAPTRGSPSSPTTSSSAQDSTTSRLSSSSSWRMLSRPAGYMVLSLPFSAATIMSSSSKATGINLLLLICDTIMVGLLTAAASAAAAAMVYVARFVSRINLKYLKKLNDVGLELTYTNLSEHE